LGRHACGDLAQFDEVADPEGFIQVQIAGVALCRRGGGAEKVQVAPLLNSMASPPLSSTPISLPASE
jgi:hypothetical protein